MASTKKIVVSLAVAGISVGLLTNPSFALSLVRPPRPSFSSAAKISNDQEKAKKTSADAVEVTATADVTTEPAPATTTLPKPEPEPEPATTAAPTEPTTAAPPATGAANEAGAAAPVGTGHADGAGNADGAAETTTTVKKDDRTPATLELTCHLLPKPTRASVVCTWTGATPAGATNLKLLRNDGRVRLSSSDTSIRSWTDDDAGAGKHFSYVVIFMAAENAPTIAHSNAFAIDTPAAPAPRPTEAPKPATTIAHSEPTTTAPHGEPTTTAPHSEPTTTVAHNEPTTVTASIQG